MRLIEKYLKDVTTVQRIFVAIFITYYLCRHEAYTWYYSDLLMKWPGRSILSFDPVELNHLFPILLFAWLFTGLWYFVKPRLFSGTLFFVFSYLIVGRLNSYVFILRYDFSPMTYLLLTILLPHGEDSESQKIKDWIVFLGKFTWVSCFVTAAVAKFDAVGISWVKPEILRNFIFFENIMQGPGICQNTTRITVVNFLLQNNVIMGITSVVVLAFELLYPLALFSRRMAWIFLISSFFFQITIQYLMHIEYYNYWVGILFWLMPVFSHRKKVS